MNMKTYPCGCEAEPAEEVPDYCPDHGLKLPTEEQADAQIEAQKRAMGLNDPFPPGHLGDYMVQVRAERDLYRDALNDLFQSIDQAAHAKAIQWDRHSPAMNAARKALGL